MNPHMYYAHILLLLLLCRIFSLNQKLSLVRALKIVSYMLPHYSCIFSSSGIFAFNICLILAYKTSVKLNISLPHESRCVLYLLIRLFLKKVLISLVYMRFMGSPKTDMTETLRRQLFPHQSQRFESSYSN